LRTLLGAALLLRQVLGLLLQVSKWPASSQQYMSHSNALAS
jgi:hypothetical protein